MPIERSTRGEGGGKGEGEEEEEEIYRGEQAGQAGRRDRVPCQI